MKKTLLIILAVLFTVFAYGQEETQSIQYKLLEYDTTTFETTHTEILTLQPIQGKKKKKKGNGSDSVVYVLDADGQPWVMYRYKETATKPISLWEQTKLFLKN